MSDKVKTMIVQKLDEVHQDPIQVVGILESMFSEQNIANCHAIVVAFHTCTGIQVQALGSDDDLALITDKIKETLGSIVSPTGGN